MSNPYANMEDRAPRKPRKNIFVETGTYDARFVGYVETGLHPQPVYKGEQKDPAKMAQLTFAIVDERRDYGDEIGEQQMLITEKVALFYGDNSKRTKFFKALKACDGADSLGHLAALAFEGIPCTIYIEGREGERGGQKWVYNNVHPANIKGAYEDRRDPATKKYIRVPVDVTPYEGIHRIFLWDQPTLEAYDSLLGWQQKQIKEALNFVGSPIHKLLLEEGRLADSQQEPTDGMAEAGEAPDMDDVPF